jgi:hypothetical protein
VPLSDRLEAVIIYRALVMTLVNLTQLADTKSPSITLFNVDFSYSLLGELCVLCGLFSKRGSKLGFSMIWLG